MKRRIALLTAILMLCAILLPVSVMADGEKSMEDMIKIVKGKITVPSDYTEFNYSINSDMNKKIWRFNWNSKKPSEGGSIGVSVDESGKILDYNNYKPFQGTARKLPKINRKEALEKAKAFLAKINPSVVSQIKLSENTQDIRMGDGYSFRFARVENGIPFYSDYVMIQIDRNTGEVQNYNTSWTENVVFPKADKVISMQDAQKAYMEKLGIRLTYNNVLKDGKSSIYAAYRPKYDYLSIDAITGGKVNVQSNYYGFEYAKASSMRVNGLADSIGNIALTPEETSAAQKVSKLITKDEAEKKARGFKYLALSDDIKLVGAELSKDWSDPDSFIWQLEFRSDEGKDKSFKYVSVRLDASTSELKGFNTNYPSGDGKAKYDEAKSKAAVEAFLKDIQPEKFKEAEYDDSVQGAMMYKQGSGLPQNYDFNYVRKVNGVYFVGNSLHVNYDAVNCEIISYDMSWSNANFPSVEKAISIDKAYENMFKNIGLELYYSTEAVSEEVYKRMAMSGSNIKPNIKLVYSISQIKPAVIDAFTGSILDNNGGIYKENKPVVYKDISDCFAKNQIEVLAENGIAFTDENFKPDSKITQKDFLLLLSKAINPYVINPYSSYQDNGNEELYNFMIREGIIKENEKNPDADVTREEATRYIVRALKYDKVAEIKGIFNCSFKDKDSINPDLLGYISIAQGLKIINGSSDGYFSPKGNLSRAQAAVIIYNYLEI